MEVDEIYIRVEGKTVHIRLLFPIHIASHQARLLVAIFGNKDTWIIGQVGDVPTCAYRAYNGMVRKVNFIPLEDGTRLDLRKRNRNEATS